MMNPRDRVPDEIRVLAARLEQIDAGGTRGVAVLSVQLQELAKDFARHEAEHERERRERIIGRRWAVGAVVAAIAAIDGPVVSVLLALHR